MCPFQTLATNPEALVRRPALPHREAAHLELDQLQTHLGAAECDPWGPLWLLPAETECGARRAAGTAAVGPGPGCRDAQGPARLGHSSKVITLSVSDHVTASTRRDVPDALGANLGRG